MYENSHTWRRKLRIQTLVVIARKEMQQGKNFDEFSLRLEQEMKVRWRLVESTRRHYLVTVKKVLDNQFVLAN